MPRTHNGSYPLTVPREDLRTGPLVLTKDAVQLVQTSMKKKDKARKNKKLQTVGDAGVKQMLQRGQGGTNCF